MLIITDNGPKKINELDIKNDKILSLNGEYYNIKEISTIDRNNYDITNTYNTTCKYYNQRFYILKNKNRKNKNEIIYELNNNTCTKEFCYLENINILYDYFIINIPNKIDNNIIFIDYKLYGILLSSSCNIIGNDTIIINKYYSNCVEYINDIGLFNDNKCKLSDMSLTRDMLYTDGMKKIVYDPIISGCDNDKLKEIIIGFVLGTFNIDMSKSDKKYFKLNIVNNEPFVNYFNFILLRLGYMIPNDGINNLIIPNLYLEHTDYMDDNIIYHDNVFYFKMKYITRSLNNDIIHKLVLENSYNYTSFHGIVFS